MTAGSLLSGRHGPEQRVWTSNPTSRAALLDSLRNAGSVNDISDLGAAIAASPLVEVSPFTGDDPASRAALLNRAADITDPPDGTGEHVITGDLDFHRALLRRKAICADLLQQVETSTRQLETQLAALRNAKGDHDLLDQGEAKLHQLNSLRDQLAGGAFNVPLASIQAQVTSAIAGTQAYVSSFDGAAGATQAAIAEQVALGRASDAAHRTAMDFSRDFYERRIFDPYLRFASTEDEDIYRRREAERQRAIEAALAENTPESNLRATQLELDQLHDAGAHGADRSPEYQRDLHRLANADSSLRAAIAAKSSPSAASSSDPLDAVSPLANVPPELVAGLRASGVSVPDQKGEGHGVSVGLQQSAARSPV